MTPRQRDTLWYALTLSILGVMVALIWLRAPQPTPPRPIPSAYYVWQLQWNDAVREAVKAADSSASAFMVLVGEVHAADGTLRLQRGYPDWSALSKIHSPITIVLRANAALSGMLQDDSRDNAIAFMSKALEDIIADANKAGATIRGLQLDYDSPSAKLASYKTLLDALLPRFNKLELSITALPTWLKWSDFKALVSELDYYVLQVHSLERPSSYDHPVTLCDTSRIPGYLDRAASVGAPFYLALPTYGYRFVFDDQGTFAAISAEGSAPLLKPGQRIRTVMTEPKDIANVVREVRADPPHNLIGFVWFRLPVARDELNWTWQTLQAVRDGRAPEASFRAEVKNPSPDLYEIYVSNNGESLETGTVQTTVRFDTREVIASDTHNGFSLIQTNPQSANIAGPAPRPGDSVLAAWFRFKPGIATSPPPIQVGSVAKAPNH